MQQHLHFQSSRSKKKVRYSSCRCEKKKKKVSRCRSGVDFLALTTREDFFIGAVEGQAENVGQVLPLQFHWLGPSVNGFLHVPQQHPPIISSCRQTSSVKCWYLLHRLAHINLVVTHNIICKSPAIAVGCKNCQTWGTTSHSIPTNEPLTFQKTPPHTIECIYLQIWKH